MSTVFPADDYNDMPHVRRIVFRFGRYRVVINNCFTPNQWQFWYSNILVSFGDRDVVIARFKNAVKEAQGIAS